MLPRFRYFLSRIFFGGLSGVVHCLGGGVLPCCRFTPSCSQYAAESVCLHGWWAGSVLAARRLYRCRPRLTGQKDSWGVDPVPRGCPRPENPWRSLVFWSAK